MQVAWGRFWQNTKGRWKTGWLITAGLIALYLGAIQANDRTSGNSQHTGTGDLSAAWDPISLWRSPLHAVSVDSAEVRGSALGAFSGSAAKEARLEPQPATLRSELKVSEPKMQADDRKLVRNGSMDLIVQHPSDVAERIRQLAEQMGGFLVSSETAGAGNATCAVMAIRVPAARFEEARAGILKLGLRVESEKLEAQDVTKQYVDQAARLRNLRAQETQYLGILKQAKTVKDTLAVSDKLNEVRGEIEQQQAEFDALSKQVETVTLTVTLRAEADAQVFGLHWRPRISSSWRPAKDWMRWQIIA